uniref:CASP-like protein n=1 Tax=Caenorhabditis tropicalis TaxID=1561998 RepID=A0A1I7U7W8_9PELO
MMASNSIVVQKPPSSYMCSFSLYASTVIMAVLQTFLSALLAANRKKKMAAAVYYGAAAVADSAGSTNCTMRKGTQGYEESMKLESKHCVRGVKSCGNIEETIY